MAKKKVVEVNKEPQEEQNISTLIDNLFVSDPDYVRLDQIDDSVTEWIDSGSLAINFIVSNSFLKGYPCGRITQFLGEPGSGKSLLICSALKDKNVGFGMIIETEGGGLSTSLLDYAKVDRSKVRQKKINSFDSYEVNSKGNIEEIKDEEYDPKKLTHVSGLIYNTKKFLDIVKMKAEKSKIILGIDSIANLTSAKELSGSTDMGKRGQLSNKFFRTFDNILDKLNIACLITNKVYANTNATKYEPKTVAAGGMGVEYNSSTILQLTRMANSNILTDAENAKERENLASARGASIVAVKVRNTKSRFGCYGRTVTISLDMSKGILRYSGMFDICSDYGMIGKSGSYYGFINKDIYDKNFYKKEFEEVLINGGEDLLNKIETEIKIIQKKDYEESEKFYEVSDAVIQETVEKAIEVENG